MATHVSPSRRPHSVTWTVLKLLINKAFIQINNYINCGSDGFPPQGTKSSIGVRKKTKEARKWESQRSEMSASMDGRTRHLMMWRVAPGDKGPSE